MSPNDGRDTETEEEEERGWGGENVGKTNKLKCQDLDRRVRKGKKGECIAS